MATIDQRATAVQVGPRALGGPWGCLPNVRWRLQAASSPSRREGQTKGLAGRIEVGAPAHPWTPFSAGSLSLAPPGHHGMDQVRASSP
jgi:hypothetical protein